MGLVSCLVLRVKPTAAASVGISILTPTTVELVATYASQLNSAFLRSAKFWSPSVLLTALQQPEMEPTQGTTSSWPIPSR